MSDRGIKKWAPYQSLREFGEEIRNNKTRRKKVDKPIISSDIKNEINEVLVNYHNETLVITYFDNGEIKQVETKIKKIDCNNKSIKIDNNKIIKISSIIRLEPTLVLL